MSGLTCLSQVKFDLKMKKYVLITLLSDCIEIMEVKEIFYIFGRVRMNGVKLKPPCLLHKFVWLVCSKKCKCNLAKNYFTKTPKITCTSITCFS
jgi:hypothetical protein